jgi:hypothetical protein
LLSFDVCALANNQQFVYLPSVTSKSTDTSWRFVMDAACQRDGTHLRYRVAIQTEEGIRLRKIGDVETAD